MPVFTGILAGWDQAIAAHYLIANEINSRTTSRAGLGSDGLDTAELLGKLYGLIEGNLRKDPLPKSLFHKNWRHLPQLDLAPLSKSTEKVLEKRIAAILPGWANQVPCCSGYAGSRQNRKNSIDLVREAVPFQEYDFVELKTEFDSGPPFYAAFEILSYGLLHVFARTHEPLWKNFREKSGEKPSLRATLIHLKVLAPEYYYQADSKISLSQLKLLEDQLNAGLAKFVKGKVPGLTMTFSFWSFSNPVGSLDEIRSFGGFTGLRRVTSS